MDRKIQFQKGDVQLVAREPEMCPDCDIRPATHEIRIDLRGIGADYGIEFYCEECGKERVDAIRATLPEDTEDGTVSP